jgi:hypothetical protein
MSPSAQDTDKQDTDKEAYDRGAAAAAQAKTADDNPYAQGGAKHKSWEQGYLDAQKAAQHSDPGAALRR